MKVTPYSFKLPDLGEGTVESEIVAWRAGIGDQVSSDQPLVDMMTDKATIEITAPVSGELISVAGEPGDIIAVGAELAVFATNGEQPVRPAGGPVATGGTPSSPGSDNAHVPATGCRPIHGRQDEEVSETPAPAPAPGRPQTSPAIRRLARENNIDLSRVHGTGPNGRITRADIVACLDQSGGQSGEDAGPGATGVREIRLQGLRRKTAEQMALSASRIPHFSYVEEVDVTELDRLRAAPDKSARSRFGRPKGARRGCAREGAHHKSARSRFGRPKGARRGCAREGAHHKSARSRFGRRRAPAGGAPGRAHITNLPGADLDVRRAPAGGAPGRAHITELTYLPFFMQALVKVVKAFPQCNAHFDDERQVIRQFDPVHIGIAVQTRDGLMAPVIRHVETLDLWQCARALREAADKARNGSATREDLTGSTITITSLGALGGIVSTPIINYPEVAIIGINRIQQRQVLKDGAATARLMMNLSSSFDHRVVDGYDAARAIQALKSYLESPATIFLPES